VKVFRQVCIPRLLLQVETQVSTLPPSASDAVRSGAPHAASICDSGCPTQLCITVFAVVHALRRSANASGAAWRIGTIVALAAESFPVFSGNALSNLRDRFSVGEQLTIMYRQRMEDCLVAFIGKIRNADSLLLQVSRWVSPKKDN
jgi:hypothetical protein